MEKDIKVTILTGHESRPEAVLVQIASRYSSSVYIMHENKIINAKSIMGMLNLGICNGMTLKVKAEGLDEAAVIEAMEKYLTGAEE